MTRTYNFNPRNLFMNTKKELFSLILINLCDKNASKIVVPLFCI